MLTCPLSIFEVRLSAFSAVVTLSLCGQDAVGTALGKGEGRGGVVERKGKEWSVWTGNTINLSNSSFHPIHYRHGILTSTPSQAQHTHTQSPHPFTTPPTNSLPPTPTHTHQFAPHSHHPLHTHRHMQTDMHTNTPAFGRRVILGPLVAIGGSAVAVGGANWFTEGRMEGEDRGRQG